MRVLEEVAFTDDTLVASYLAGVLAASGPEDDMGAAVVAQIGRLSALQLRLRYVLYRSVWQLDRADVTQSIDLRDPDQLQDAYSLFMPLDEIYAALDLLDVAPAAERVSSMLRILAREDLIAGELGGSNWRVTPGYAVGSPTRLATMFRSRQVMTPGPGVVVGPTPAGIELFLWGCGGADPDPMALRTLPRELVDQYNAQVPECPGAATLRELADRA